ncbi:MAG TPA: peptide deformylase [Methanocorpusculum sp.]|nr:peptide deformylase [Methanocorpusculum sp.]
MIREIRLFGDPVLLEHAADVASIGPEEIAVLDDMTDTMRAHKCVGLSAPQIGVSKRLFIVDAGGVFIRGANPEILSEGALCEDLEGSPCLPGVAHRPVRRPKKIVCRYLSEEGMVECELKGIAARAFCHEKDHHEGILFIDRLKPIQRRMAVKEFEAYCRNQNTHN